MKKPEGTDSNESGLDFQISTAKAAYDYALERYKLQNQFFDSISTKNSIAISLAALLLSAVTGFIYYIFKERPEVLKQSGAIEYIFLGVLALIIALIIIAFWKAVGILNLKYLTDADTAENLIGFIQSGSEGGGEFLIKLHAHLAESLAGAEASIMEANIKHAGSFKIIIAVLKAAVILIAFILTAFVVLAGIY
jgi:hypothetical protein